MDVLVRNAERACAIELAIEMLVAYVRRRPSVLAIEAVIDMLVAEVRSRARKREITLLMLTAVE